MASNTHSLRSALGKVRGLGSAKEGTHHWWLQRLTALALLPLTIWFVASLIGLSGFGHEGFVSWFGQPVNATIMILFIAMAFHHAQLGMQVVIEDYVHGEVRKLLSIMLNNFVALIIGVSCVFAVIKIALT